MPTPSSVLIVGCGYLGQRVGRRLVELGSQVYGTTRSPSKADHLTELGITPVLADVTHPESLMNMPEVTGVLYCVGFDRRAGHSIRQVYVDGFRGFLNTFAVQQATCPIVYASSTGVYGGNDGAWVDEVSPADPQTESGRACLAAEQLLAEHADRQASGALILRYAGLYGPDRIMRRDSLQRGEPILGNPDKFLNFIQIDDAAAVTAWALENLPPRGCDLLLVSDGHPVTRTEFYGAAAELLGAPSPRFETPAPGSPEASREESNKRIQNGRLLERWGNHLRYPEIRAGLAASLAGS